MPIKPVPPLKPVAPVIAPVVVSGNKTVCPFTSRGPLPEIFSGAVISGSAVMTVSEVTSGSMTIVLFAWALALTIASRRDPAPLSDDEVTV
jgi:hypothetical protein